MSELQFILTLAVMGTLVGLLCYVIVKPHHYNDYWANRKLIAYHLILDPRIDAEYCMYLRLVYRRDDNMWSSLRVPTVNEEAIRTRLRTLQRQFHGSEHVRISGSLHVLMAKLGVEKKRDVFNLDDAIIRKHYYDFITQIKEEG